MALAMTAALVVANPVYAGASAAAPVPTRDYGTPTPDASKTCPFTGDIPVSLPAVHTPLGTPPLPTADVSAVGIPATIYGELCMSAQARAEANAGSPPPVLVLVHGVTYGTWYWDLPYQPAKYSTVNRLVEHGYATLNIDRIGEGRSSHPASALVDLDTNAETVHQLITKLRAGDVGGIAFAHVGLVGHSFGSATSWLETAKYNDADMVIGTGYGNRIKPDVAASILTGVGPAAISPYVRNEPWALDPGYLMFRSGTRADTPFFNKANMDPAVLDLDERLQNSVTAEELATFPSREYDGTHKNIAIPTFIIDGQNDSIFCGSDDVACATKATKADSPRTVEADSAALRAYEAPGFSPTACMRAAVIPDMGHDITLHENSVQTADQIAYFADQAMGLDGRQAASYRRTCATSAPTLADQLPETGRLVPPTNLGIGG